MKINHDHDIRGQRDAAITSQTPSPTKSFQTSFQSQVLSQKKQEIDQMIKNISIQGNKLARTRNFRDLAKFKHLIKDFLKETVSGGLRLEKDQSFTMHGSQQYILVKEIDEKLIELTELMMDQEQRNVNILGLIGEIKGLLVNLTI